MDIIRKKKTLPRQNHFNRQENFPEKSAQEHKQFFSASTTHQSTEMTARSQADSHPSTKKFIQRNDFSQRQGGNHNPLFYNSPKNSKHAGRKFKKTLKFIFISILLITVIVCTFLAYTLFKVHKLSQKISINGTTEAPSILQNAKSIITSISKKDPEILKGQKDGRINVLLLGIAGEGKPGTNLTDTIMIASFNSETKKVALMSLPRDLYVEVPDYSYKTKINSVYQFGINQQEGVTPLLETIKNITNLEMHYYVIMNFDGFEKIIDDIGGITITNERDIYDPKYPGPNYSYELFELKKGTHLLDGKTALKYARQRHGDPEGDFGRAKRQQQVLQSFKNKFFSTKTLLNIFTINDVLNTLGDNVKTDIQIDEIESFLLTMEKYDTQNINNAVVDAWKKDSLLRVSHIYYETGRAFILVPRAGNFSEIQELAKNIFEMDKITRKKKEIEKENARVAIINYSSNSRASQKIKDLMDEGLGFENTIILKNIYLPALVPDKTTIFDSTSGQKPFSLDELIKKIPAELPRDFSKTKKDFETNEYDLFVVIGKDMNDLYQYEKTMENTEEEYDQIYMDLINQN